MTKETSSWQELEASAEALSQASQQLERQAGSDMLSASDLAKVRTALQLVTASGKRLSRQLDDLARRCNAPHRAEPTDSQVALDQAAAAAEDLGNCTRVAAQALEEGQ